MTAALLHKIRSKSARVGVIGLGYVGLPLVVEFAKAGVRAVGFDIDRSKVDGINRGESYIADVATDDLKSVVDAGALRATTDFAALTDVDTINICVPTPLRKTKDPDLSFVVAAVDQIATHLRTGQLVILESTTYPGTVNEVVQPRLEERGLRIGVDFFPAFSPERVDPGTPNGRRAISRRSSAASTPAPRSWRRRSTGSSSKASCRSRHRALPKWSSCSRTGSGRSISAWSTSWH